ELAEQHEQRNAGEQILVERAPDDGRDRVDERSPESGDPAEDANRRHRDGDRYSDEHRRQHQQEDQGSRNGERHAASCVVDLNSADGGITPCAPRRCAKSSSSSLTSSFALFGWKSRLTLSMSPRASSHMARAAEPTASSANTTRPAYQTLCGQISGVCHGVGAVLRYASVSATTLNATDASSTANAASSTYESAFSHACMRLEKCSWNTSTRMWLRPSSASEN